MEIDGGSPWKSLRNGVPRIDLSRQTGKASKSGGIQLHVDGLEPSIRDLEIFHLKELIRATPDVRESRIAEVLGDIAGGTYHVMAESIAEKIMGGDLLDAFM